MRTRVRMAAQYQHHVYHVAFTTPTRRPHMSDSIEVKPRRPMSRGALTAMAAVAMLGVPMRATPQTIHEPAKTGPLVDEKVRKADAKRRRKAAKRLREVSHP